MLQFQWLCISGSMTEISVEQKRIGSAAKCIRRSVVAITCENVGSLGWLECSPSVVASSVLEIGIHSINSSYNK